MFNQKTKKLNPSQQMLSDPTMMTGMLKKNLNMIVPQMLTATWVNFFFTGFVVGKVPFPLTQRFRGAAAPPRGRRGLSWRAQGGQVCARGGAGRRGQARGSPE